MELIFLALLVLIMISALMSGYPVAFALPGSAILTIGLAALCGAIFAGHVDAYFAQDGPTQWLNAGVTNFRSLYWDVERDTLIAIPLFIFMGIMLQRSRIAEDLLVTMAQLFGPIPGGLGISVVFVGALLAATTGIVGATVIAMGLISLPAMLRNNYSKPLATGTICASGTLGQIIPPSIVLIILVDQLSSAADQASTVRQADYKAATGEFSMPAEFDISAASAGDMFMGAFFPGLVLVGLYMAYILIVALIRPSLAPPVPSGERFDLRFLVKVLLALVPPLALIFLVLGSIILGVATVNQAGAVGAIGAMIMAGYRLKEGQPRAYYPAILAVLSVLALVAVLSQYDLNIKNIQPGDIVGLQLATLAVTGLLIAIGWSAWRAFRIDETLSGVMIETAKTTSMVFIILLGAAMLTAAFRAFGGEELVKEFLTGLPGGFWTQFLVVMLVIFLLGFFLDFIEIAVVVVPIVAPILLADPAANVTAVWLGVMIGMNIQTSFLTPPFGFALFYLRGVAPPDVKTLHIYKGAAAFICLQLLGLTITGFFPGLVNYLPNRVFLTAETAPPPQNPRLQYCLEQQIFPLYDENGDMISASIDQASGLDFSYLPEDLQDGLSEGFESARTVFDQVAAVRSASAATAAAAVDYRPLHVEVREIQREIRGIEEEIDHTERDLNRVSREENVSEGRVRALEERIARLDEEREALNASIPEEWDEQHEAFAALTSEENRAKLTYRRTVDTAYEPVLETLTLIGQADAVDELRESIVQLDGVIGTAGQEEAMEAIESVEDQLDLLDGTGEAKSALSRARRALRGDEPDVAESMAQLAEAIELHDADVAWRRRAADELVPGLQAYDDVIKGTIGARLQARLSTELATEIASCQSVHRDVSLNF